MRKIGFRHFLDWVSIYLDYLKLHFLKLTKIPVGNKISLQGYKVHFGDMRSLDILFKEIFLKQIYNCELGDKPLIIDGGANIGLAILYFKKKIPEARIIGFEPNPDSFNFLEQNVKVNNLENVEIHNAALGKEDGFISFYTSSDMVSADIGASAIKHHVEYHHTDKGELQETKVPCMKLSPFINQSVDLLKLDIEGNESEVISDLDVSFKFVGNSIMEYHYHANYDHNPLSNILSVMEKCNHHYLVSPVGKKDQLKDERAYIIKSQRKVS